ncbi:hypothetical protein GobsT_02750 [Gemmata obscuriglobus]|uniref:Uncharacterized protein n=1 Tax=Gemmata obscuriglobus TaxID=114 RepID=A0A2Z3HC32_9BACT|nr:hypothetical protein C1280_31780 [Gemmata obscuriglobus]QEG25548.1 hypothetical protein GobsT_02750 [Gemmata obscuriglobus]VTR98914.1 unnamed protein product [Gemmata obscuriglobus UQM 2246]
MADEQLKRFGTTAESAERLAQQAAAAETVLGIHGVSVTARDTNAPAGVAPRSEVEKHFPVHNTPSRRDPQHRTVELPKPVTPEVADRFNRLFGRSE